MDPDIFQSGELFSNEYLSQNSWNGREHKRLFRNEGNGTFKDVAVGLGVDAIEDARSSIFFDMDRDGDLDLLVTNINENQPVRLFRNDLNEKRNWLMLKPVGVTANCQAVGTVVNVTVGGKTRSNVIVAGQGYQTSYCGPVHIGLGDAAKADRIEVIFPGGQSRVLENVASNQRLTVYEDGRLAMNRTTPTSVGSKQPR